MVAGCPKCSARYRVDADRIGADGAKLRCTKCSAVFLVRAPKHAAPPAPSAPAGTPARAEASASASAASPRAEGGSSGGDTREWDRERLVLIADPDPTRGKRTAEAVEAWGLQALLVADGVEAMLGIQRELPRAVVLDAALPKMFGFQVCEVVKRNESLRDTIVVLVGAINNQDRYRRAPSDLYGADVYVEQPDLPDALRPFLEEHGMPLGGGPARETPPAPRPTIEPPAAPPTPSAPDTASAPTPSPTPSAAPEAASAPAAPEAPTAPAAPADEDPERAEERERARRLARIAVSEMVLYQPEKFERAAREGNLEQVLDLEIQEAQALLRQRIGEAVRAETDFILDELHRVAAERSGNG